MIEHVDSLVEPLVLPSDRWDIEELYGDGEYNRVFATQSIFLATVRDWAADLEENKVATEAYFSDSWPKEIKRIRKEKGLPVGDMARVAPLVDHVSGQERSNRGEEHVFATDDDSNYTADLANMYLRYRRRSSSIAHANSMVFHNALAGNRAHTEYEVVTHHDGTFKVNTLERPFWEVFIQKPYIRYDTSDSPGRFHAPWYTKSELKHLYGHKKIKWDLLQWQNHDLITKTTRYRGDQYTKSADADEPPDIGYPGVFYDETKHMIRLIRYWQKRWANEFIVVDNVNSNDLSNYKIGTYKTKGKARAAALKHLLKAGTHLGVRCKVGRGQGEYQICGTAKRNRRDDRLDGKALSQEILQLSCYFWTGRAGVHRRYWVNPSMV